MLLGQGACQEKTARDARERYMIRGDGTHEHHVGDSRCGSQDVSPARQDRGGPAREVNSGIGFGRLRELPQETAKPLGVG
jgi:hypothetical protein